MARVTVLFDGYSEQLDETRMNANCSCTLIQAEKNIIVDTMTAWDGDKIKRAIAEHGLSPEDIDYVVCSHGHPDHTGNNNLFRNAEHIVGWTVHRETMFYEKNLQNDDYELCKGVTVVPTPGHTLEDVTVLVDAKIDEGNAKIAITGDLFEKFEDLEDPKIWQDVGDPRLRDVQERSRARILELADYVVPGHGGMFVVPKTAKKSADNLSS